MTKLHLEISIAEHLEVKPFWIDPAVMERIANVLKNKKDRKNEKQNRDCHR